MHQFDTNLIFNENSLNFCRRLKVLEWKVGADVEVSIFTVWQLGLVETTGLD